MGIKPVYGWLRNLSPSPLFPGNRGTPQHVATKYPFRETGVEIHNFQFAQVMLFFGPKIASGNKMFRITLE